MDAIKGESHTQVGNLVFVADGSRRAMEIGARSAPVGHNALGSESLQFRDGLGGSDSSSSIVNSIGVFCRRPHPSRRIDMLHGNLVAGFDFTAERRITSGERYYGANFDGLAIAIGGKANSVRPTKSETRISRLIMPPLPGF